MEDVNSDFSISYHSLVVAHDMSRFSREWKIRIKNAIEEKLTAHPEVFGKPLSRSLAGHRKLRVGEYRVIFVIERCEVKVMVIGHRKEVYQMAEKRLSRYFFPH